MAGSAPYRVRHRRSLMRATFGPPRGEGVAVESTADRRLNPEPVHEPRCHPRPRDRLRPLAANQREDIQVPRDRMLDDVVERPPVEGLEVGRRHLPWRPIPDRVQPFGRGIGQRPEEISVEYEQHRGTERDPEAQGDDRGEGKARRLGQTASGDADFGQHRGSIAKTPRWDPLFVARILKVPGTFPAKVPGTFPAKVPGTLGPRLSVPELSSSERGGGGGRICSR